jgi:hypothetical protein
MVSRAVLLQLGHAFIDRQNSLIENLDNFLTLRTPDALHTIYPMSMGKKPKLTNDEQMEILRSAFPNITSVDITLNNEDESILIDEVQSKIYLHLKGTLVTDIGTYVGEFYWTLLANEDGTKIKETWETVDSYTAKEYFKNAPAA